MRIDGYDIELLAQLASGMPMNRVAARLGISERTMRRRTRDLCDRIGVTTPIEAVVWTAQRDLI